MTDTERLIRAYYAAFDAGDRDAMLALLAEDVIHDVNQGPRETGKPAFRAFLAIWTIRYREAIRDLVVMVDATGTPRRGGIPGGGRIPGDRSRPAGRQRPALQPARRRLLGRSRPGGSAG